MRRSLFSLNHASSSVMSCAAAIGIAFAFTTALIGSAANADVIWIQAFEGERHESFEHQQPRGEPTHCVEGGVFDGAARLCALHDRRSCLITGAWTAHCTSLPRSGAWFFGSLEGGVEYIFEHPARRFGGWFQSNTEVGGAQAIFYGPDGGVLAKRVIEFPPTCEWVWNGWEFDGDGGGIARVEIIGNFRVGGHVMMDDMQYDAFDGGHDGLNIVVEGHCPGVVEVFASHATPGETVYFVWGVGQGEGRRVPGCPDLAINVVKPLDVDSARASHEGVAMIHRELSERACKHALVQAVEPHTCRKSDVRSF